MFLRLFPLKSCVVQLETRLSLKRIVLLSRATLLYRPKTWSIQADPKTSHQRSIGSMFINVKGRYRLC